MSWNLFSHYASLKKFARGQQSSLFCQMNIDEEKKLYNTATRGRVMKPILYYASLKKFARG